MGAGGWISTLTPAEFNVSSFQFHYLIRSPILLKFLALFLTTCNRHYHWTFKRCNRKGRLPPADGPLVSSEGGIGSVVLPEKESGWPT